MSGRWAARFAPECVRLAVALRTATDVQACERPDGIWLCGTTDARSQQQWGRRAAGGELFRVLDDGQLLPFGGRVPRGRLPDGPWQSIATWAAIEAPLAAFPAARPAKTALTLVRGGEAAEPDVLIAPLDAWHTYVEVAPRVRFRSLKFAASADSRALIVGKPLPPLAGDRYVRRDQIAAPAGWTWSPPVDAASLAKAFGAAPSDLLVWHANGSLDVVAAECLSTASRSAVRATAEWGAS